MQRDLDRDQSNHADSLHDDKLDHKMGRDYRNVNHHPGMVHLHSGIEHLTNNDMEVRWVFSQLLFINRNLYKKKQSSTDKLN